jgi:hypothetical protein
MLTSLQVVSNWYIFVTALGDEATLACTCDSHQSDEHICGTGSVSMICFALLARLTHRGCRPLRKDAGISCGNNIVDSMVVFNPEAMTLKKKSRLQLYVDHGVRLSTASFYERFACQALFQPCGSPTKGWMESHTHCIGLSGMREQRSLHVISSPK